MTITDFSDPTAQVNALLGGQIDAMTDLPPSQVKVLQARSVGALVSKTGGWLPICMAIDMPPFDDVRVRQAMRLIVDRPGMLEQVFSGYGFVGNDLYAPFDPGYDKSLPQRHQDIAQAKSLLKAAGHANLSVDLHTTDGAAGMVDTATVFANQASAAGVKINVINDPNFYGNQYLKLAFSVDFWGTRAYLNQVQQGSLPTLPVQRDALAAEVGHRVQLRVAVQPGHWPDRRDQAHPDRARDAADRVQHRRVHHPVLRWPHRRLRDQGEGAQAEQGHPQPG